MSGGTHFPRKFCPTGQDILSASRIICPGLGGKSVRQKNVSGPDPISLAFRGVSRIFIIGFPTGGVGRYFNRGGEATSATQLNPGNLNSVCVAHVHEGSCKHTIPYTK